MTDTLCPSHGIPPRPPRGPAHKIMMVAALFVAALIPGWMIAGLIGDREARQAQMAREFGATWGPEQTLSAPLLVVPYRIGELGPRRYLKIPAAQLAVTAALSPEQHRRGLFHATVFDADIEMHGTFHIPPSDRLAEATQAKAAILLWQESFVTVVASGLAGIKATDGMVWDGHRLPWQNCRDIVASDDDCQGNGLLLANLHEVTTPQPEHDIPFAVTLSLRGSGAFGLQSHGKRLDVAMSAPWPTPSFGGSVLPVASTVSATGFEAHWQTVDYSAPQAWASAQIAQATTFPATTIRTDLLDAVPTYRMIHRASKYDALFLALSFATYFLFELLAGLRIHLVQYGLMGLSLSLFALLLLSLAEPLGYDFGFLASALLVLIQASLYTLSVARNWRPAGLFAAMLAVLFGFLYVLLSLETYSLLVGSLALFLVLSVIMALTRRIDWTASATTGAGDGK